MFRLTPKFGLHRVLRTDQRRKSRSSVYFFVDVEKDKNEQCVYGVFLPLGTDF